MRAPGGPPRDGSANGDPDDGNPASTFRNGFGRAALALGLLGITTCWIGIGGLAGIAAVVFGVLGRSRARRSQATNGGVATTGMVLGVLSTSITLLLIGGTWTFYERHGDDMRRYQECRSDPSQDPAVCQQRFQNAVTVTRSSGP